ncbi:MAG: DUF5082 family protein [Lactobacillus sp.]|nr:DUF5082 family protein [Lactobacillus sp.]
MKKLSDEQAKAEKIAKANSKRSEVNSKRSQISENKSKKNTVDRKIERLKAAKKEVENAITAMKTQKRILLSNLQKFDSGKFSGERKDKYIEALDEAGNAIDKMIAKHEANKLVIDAKITELGGLSHSLDSIISILSDSINFLLSEIATLI